MATSTTSKIPDNRTDPPRRGRSLLRWVLIAVVAAAMVLGGTLLGLRAARAGVLPRTTVDGIRVGGSSEAELRDRLERFAETKGEAAVQAVREDQTHPGTGAELGYELDVDATVERIWYRGRQGNPVTALRDHLRAFATTTEVPPVESVDDAALTAWAEEAAGELELGPREGGLRFDGAEIRRVEPRAGAEISVDDLTARARVVVLGGDGGDVPVTSTPVEPETTAADVDAVEQEAEQALSGPVTLRRSGARVTLDPATIGGFLRTRVDTEGDGPPIRLGVRPGRLREAIGENRISEFEQEPKSAEIVLRSGSPQVVEGRIGFVYDDRAAARQMREVLTEGGDRNVQLAGEVTEPELTTKEARDLEVVEQVSTFTTNHDCCQSRVQNIHRIADIVGGQLVMPGETFSVNDFVGERTTAKGFGEGGAIFEGEFVEQVGGGVSQFATTIYNAAFFGGYAIPEHKAHSYYISRYPVGREATLNFPNVDLKVTNNSPYGMLIGTSYTDTSITVTMYGKKWVEVSTTTGERRNVTQPETQTRTNPDLRPGETRVVQEAGADGFDITVTRTLEFPDGRTEREEIVTTYLAQPRIVERGP